MVDASDAFVNDDVTTTQEVVLIPPEDYADAARLAEEHGVESGRIPQVGIDPVSAVALVITGGATAVATVTYLIDRKKGGQVVDLRPGASNLIYRSVDVTYGLVVIITLDGSVRVEVHEPKGFFGQVTELITSLLKELLGKGATEVAEVVGGHIPDELASTITRLEA